MRHAFGVMTRYVVPLAMVLGCASSSEPSAAPDTAVVDGGAVVDTAIVDTTATDTAAGPALDTSAPDSTVEVAVDSAPDTADATPPLGPVNCLTEDFGPSSATLVDFFYQRQVGDCESSACSDFIKFDPTCVMTLQVSDVESTATLSAADCAIFKRWVTSDRLVSRLRDTVTCITPGAPGKFESTQIELSDGFASKKTFLCKDEPFESHRKCLELFRSIYFPGK